MDAGARLEELKQSLVADPGKTVPSLISFIRERAGALGRDGLILGLSGGLDSAVVAALCARALGPGKTRALVMPDRDTPRDHTRNALALGARLGIETRLLNIGPLLRKMGVYKLFFLNRLPLPERLKESLAHRAHRSFEKKKVKTPFAASVLGVGGDDFNGYLRNCTAYYRITTRLRMALLYLHAEKGNRLVVGAANKSEYRIGFFVKHGCDHAADIMPLLGLYKTQLREIAPALGIPPGIIERPSSPDITDEEALGLPYEIIDLVLAALEKGWSVEELSLASGIREEMAARIKELTDQTAHMRTVYAP